MIEQQYTVICDGCAVRGPHARSMDQAIARSIEWGWLPALGSKNYCQRCSSRPDWEQSPLNANRKEQP
jgi:hypothetical protein